MPAAVIFRLARTSRCAIVASGTRNARAISSVVRPPSVRSVSATCASSASAGWQHVKMSSSRSSANGRRRPSSSVDRAPRHVEQLRLARRSVRSRRMRSIARLRAVVTQPGARVVRDAVARPALGGDRERLLGGLLGEVEVAEEADQRGEHAAPLVAEDLLEQCQRSTSGRTSTAPPSRAAGCARRSRSRRRGCPPRTGRSRRAPPSSRRTARRSSACSPSATRTVVAVAIAWSCAPADVPGSSEIAKYSCVDRVRARLSERLDPCPGSSE